MNLTDYYESVTATKRSPRTSEKYTFIPTTRAIDVLQSNDWYPTKVVERKVRNPEYMGFQSHLIRFRRREDINNARLKETVPEIILSNSHDGMGSFALMLGFCRLVCTNGLIVSDGAFQTIRIRHQGFQDRNVSDAIENIVVSTPRIMSKIDDFKRIVLDRDERIVYGTTALLSKYGENAIKYDADQLTMPGRIEDNLERQYSPCVNSLWNVYQITQERLIEKGFRFSATQTTPKKSARAVRSIGENIRLNKSLWSITETVAYLKAA